MSSFPPTLLMVILSGLVWGTHGLSAAPEQSLPEKLCGFIVCGEEGGGVYTGFTRQQTVGLSDAYPPGVNITTEPTAWFEYVAVFSCAGNTPNNPTDVLCGEAIIYCQNLAPGSPGPYALVYRRIIEPGQPDGPWQPAGFTCFTTSVPARSGQPAELTDAMIEEQFHQTDFALPEAVMQPPDNRTLVNLPVYYQLAWPEEGFEPQEIDTTELAGFSVRIRPTLQDVTYHFGDGSSEGPTQSLGGPYPEGDITHTYVSKGAVTPSISVTYGGEVSVEGRSWQNIGASVTIDGPAVPLEVLTSRNRLFQN